MNLFNTIYDDLIKKNVSEHFPELLDAFGCNGWLWIKAQAYQESRFDPRAKSPAGARGLMQLMPRTDMEIDGDDDGFDPQGNIENGVKYLSEQYRRLAEIPHATDRLKAAFASYNGGRGYINKALALGRVRVAQPEGYEQWSSVGAPRGAWQLWPVIATLLQSPECDHGGLWPDHGQMLEYVAKIEGYFTQLILEV